MTPRRHRADTAPTPRPRRGTKASLAHLWASGWRSGWAGSACGDLADPLGAVRELCLGSRGAGQPSFGAASVLEPDRVSRLAEVADSAASRAAGPDVAGPVGVTTFARDRWDSLLNQPPWLTDPECAAYPEAVGILGGMGGLLGARAGTAPGRAGWLAAETTRLLDFAEGSWDPLGGFGWQDENGRRAPGAPAELWITGRMTHVYALGTLIGHPNAPELLRHGLAALGGRLRDLTHGGWYPAVGPGGPVRGGKAFYPHAFVVLATSSATLAGHPGAPELLDEALGVVDQRFWSTGAGMVVEGWDDSFTAAEPYRGVNAVMHGVEAFLAAWDATGAVVWRDRAAEMTERVVREFAEPNGWRVPEHFDERWHPLPDYHRDRPDDPFRPYGATVGHGLEWSRLCLQLRSALRESAPAWLVDAAQALFHRAVTDGWAVDGAEGFVYTVDWDGTPVVHQRMHWVLAEAVASAATLYAATGDPAYAHWYDTWWRYAEDHLLDRELGSWHHELDRENRPAATVWPGKPDAYHAVQATLIPRAPIHPSVAATARALRNPTRSAPDPSRSPW